MFSYLLKRFVVMAVTLFGIVVMTFVISRMTPGDPALLAVAREGASRTGGLSDVSIRETRRVMGLDRPLLLNFHFENREWHARSTVERYLQNPPGFWRDLARYELGEMNTVALSSALGRLEREKNPDRLRDLLEILPMLARIPEAQMADMPSTQALAFWRRWRAENKERLSDSRIQASVARWLDAGAPEDVREVEAAGGLAMPYLMPALFGSDPARRNRALRAAQVCASKPATWSAPDAAARPNDTGNAGNQAREIVHRWRSWWSRARLRYVVPSPSENAVNIIANTQFGLWMRQFMTFDFGVSTRDNRPVLDVLRERIPITLQLSGIAVLLTYIIAIPLGIFSATHQNRFSDRALTLILFLLYSVPMFWLAQVFILTLSDYFPTRGLWSDGAVAGALEWPLRRRILDRLWHLVLPVTVQTVVALAFLSRQMRVALLETIRQDFIRTARAKGLREGVVIYKHAVRNSLIPIITLAADLLPALIGGSVIVESIFSLNGMGKLAFEAILNRDYPVINCVFAFSALLTLVGILFSDLGYALVDPRIRFQGD